MFKKLLKKRTESVVKGQETAEQIGTQALHKSLKKNIALLQSIFDKDQTLNIREFQNKCLKAAQCCIIYFEGMVDNELVNENVIQAILRNDLSEDIDGENLLEELKSKVIVSNDVTMETDLNKIISAIINGETLFFLEGYDQVLVIDSKGWQSRAITEPMSARVVRGPREGFIESIMVNLSLVRRRIKSPDLKFQFREIGERTHTKICICYIEGLVLDNILSELHERLDKIKIDGIIDSGYIQEMIKDAPYSPFETVGFNERPDVIAGKLLEGRVALFVDGSPFVLTVPFLMVENFQANEDYYSNYILSSINRLIRGLSIISITIPGIFLSLVTYHQEMLPTPLLLSISASRQGVPFPTAISLYLMLLVFDILREVGTRMPAPIGQAVNIVGTLVLGQAAVEAKLVSAPVVIVTALTGMTTLININFLGASIVLRTFLLTGAAFMGIYGFSICFIILHLHLMSIRSFGVPYMMSLTRAANHDGQDAWIRAPWWAMTLRPKIIGANNLVREAARKSKEK